MFRAQICTDSDSNSTKNWYPHQDPDPYLESGPNRPGQMIAQIVRKKRLIWQTLRTLRHLRYIASLWNHSAKADRTQVAAKIRIGINAWIQKSLKLPEYIKEASVLPAWPPPFPSCPMRPRRRVLPAQWGPRMLAWPKHQCIKSASFKTMKADWKGSTKINKNNSHVTLLITSKEVRMKKRPNY